MIQPTLTLVHTRAGLQLPRDPRKLFWRLYLDWLATATMDETEQLERILARHAHHVRPLVDAVSDAMSSRADAACMPASLLQLLSANAWQPELSQAPLRALA